MNELTAIVCVCVFGGGDTLRGVWLRQRIDRNTGRRAAVQFFFPHMQSYLIIIISSALG